MKGLVCVDTDIPDIDIPFVDIELRGPIWEDSDSLLVDMPEFDLQLQDAELLRRQ